VTDTLTVLGEQSVVVPSTDAAEIVLTKLANSLKEVLPERNDMALEVERILDAHPLSPVLTSMPGVGARSSARVLLEVGDGSTFASAGHLASYAGITPVTHRSGSPLRGEHPALAGNRDLKRALFLSAFAALHDPASRAYCDRKHSEGKKRNAVLICLARRRCDVLHPMLKNKEHDRTLSPAAT
jgi:transposase